ncbi:Sugar phosphate permease [Parasphingorhabdus marina DSM 22363]|uniref:Sugar phosphate permease n=1 Tax=Parasphingorhabdus marina DSM 22363 TaxID=1123272 RepID=A0A1N6DGF8_9SPHN|nr:MFS transporter [Parasphingorhabdus marina]SIN69816.1 Sugar phosphate permease [Parasphingorhabdus marina DSM 22363]
MDAPDTQPAQNEPARPATDPAAPSPPDRLFYGWINTALLFFIYFAASGFVYFAYAVIFPAMVEAMDWNRGSASIAHSIGFVVLGLCYPFTAWMIGKRGVRFTMTAGLVLMLAGLLAIILLVTEVWQWTIIWGLVIGLSLALTSPLCGHTLAISWFNIRRATVLGIVVTGSAAGGFVAQPVLAAIMTRFGTWQSGWAASAVIVLIALVLARFLINRPQDIGQHPDNVDPEKARLSADRAATKPRTYRSAHNWTIRQVFGTVSVYLLMLINVTYLGTGTFLLTHGALYLSDAGIPGLQIASLMGAFILGSGSGRIPAGWLGDRFEMRWLMAIIMGLMFGSFLLFGSTDSFALLIISGFVFGACYGGLFALAPALISNFFGEASFARINAVFAPLLLPFVATVPAGAGYAYEATGSYDLAFLIGTALLALSVVAAILLKPPVFRPAESD